MPNAVSRPYIFILSGENLELAKTEIVALLKLETYTQVEEILIAQVTPKNALKIPRLAYSHMVGEIIGKSSTQHLNKQITGITWAKIYRKDFCVRIHECDNVHSKITEKTIASLIWKTLEKEGITPRVNLSNPSTLIKIIIKKNQAILCKQIWENTEKFQDRRAHYKPELHPTAMHPKMARGLVNILSPKKRLIDPFCGAGGILLEAGLMHVPFTGYDVDEGMLRRCKINLDHYKIDPQLYLLKRQDALAAKTYTDIVTDLPYGKSSKKSDEINILYARFIQKIAGRAVIVMPDFVDVKKILKKNLSKRLVVQKIIPHYVHKSLTRMIVVIDRRIR